MGQGYGFKCKNCRHEYSIRLGIGMMYPEVCRNLLQNLEQGKYGKEWQQLSKNTPYAAVDVKSVIYICNDCSRWEMGKDITLYAPNDPAAISHKQYGIKTVEEWGYVPYVTGIELKRDYHILKRYYHKCGNCGKRMHKASKDEMVHLPCPKCDEINEPNSFIMWD